MPHPSKFKQAVMGDPVWFLAILFAVTVVTRFAFALRDQTSFALAPEHIFGENIPGLDLRTGVMLQASSILQGLPFYSFYSDYGPAISIFFVPILAAMTKVGLCVPDNYHFTCGPYLYHPWLLLLLGGLVWFFWSVTKRFPHERTPLLLFLIAFFLGIPGNLGIERGNVDIMLTLLSGALLLMLIDRQQNVRGQVIGSVGAGIIAGFITNSKFFLFPLAVTAVLVSKKPLLTLLAAITTFICFAVLPALFGAPSPVTGPIAGALFAVDTMPFAHPGYLWYNHAFTATASLFTDCVKRGSCGSPADTTVIYGIWAVLFLFTFVGPLVSADKRGLLRTVTNVPLRITWLIKRFFQHRENTGAILFLAALSDATANLLPLFALNQRLYYSIPILMLLWVFTANQPRARYFCLLSMAFLIAKGWWIFTSLRPEGFLPFEVRGMNFFVVLHFFFLLKATLTYWYEADEGFTA